MKLVDSEEITTIKRLDSIILGFSLCRRYIQMKFFNSPYNTRWTLHWISYPRSLTIRHSSTPIWLSFLNRMTTNHSSVTNRRANHTASVSSATPTATEIASISPTTSSYNAIPSNRPKSHNVSISHTFGTKSTLGLPANSIQLIPGSTGTTPTASAIPFKYLTSGTHFGPAAIVFVSLSVLLCLIGLSVTVMVLVLKFGKRRRRDGHDLDESLNNSASVEPASLYETPDELQDGKTSTRPSTSRHDSYLTGFNRASSFISSPAQSFDIMRVSVRQLYKSRRSSGITFRADGPSYEPPYRLSSDTCMVMDPVMMKGSFRPQNTFHHLSFEDFACPPLTHHSSERFSNLPKALPQARPYKLSMLKKANREVHNSISHMSLASGQKVIGIGQALPTPPAEGSRDRT